MPVHSIHDTHPADRSEDAFLSGNGEYGIMVFEMLVDSRPGIVQVVQTLSSE